MNAPNVFDSNFTYWTFIIDQLQQHFQAGFDSSIGRASDIKSSHEIVRGFDSPPWQKYFEISFKSFY